MPAWRVNKKKKKLPDGHQTHQWEGRDGGSASAAIGCAVKWAESYLIDRLLNRTGWIESLMKSTMIRKPKYSTWIAKESNHIFVNPGNP